MSEALSPLGPHAVPVLRRADPDAPAPPPASEANPDTGSSRVLRALRGWTTSSTTVPGVRRTREPDPLATLLRRHRAIHPRADLEALRRAYGIADEVHQGQRRKSGEPYITHPLAVAEICAGLGMDSVALVAALLHDTVEDTSYTLDALRTDFGDEVAHLVDGVTKLDKVRFGRAAEAETIRKMILAAGRDPRVLVIKLADRLHNMRTLRFKSQPSQERIARTTRDVLVPLAGRLGIHVVKRELEDLAFEILMPEAYADIKRQVDETSAERDAYLRIVLRDVRRDLRTARVQADATSRPRHLRSVYDQMRKSDRQVDGARIVIVVQGEPGDCYTALGMVHGRWHPVPGRFKDHIGAPKFNMYQSLHTTVIGPQARPLDVIIRTEGMHRVAEYGIAALHRYSGQQPGRERCELDWLQRVLDWQAEAAEPDEFLETLCNDLSDHQMLVFSPTGEAVSLPAGATPVDFAYALSTQLGDRCFGAEVNGQLTPLSSPVSEGDVVEVLISPEYGGPSQEWLEFTKSPQAQVQIRRFFTEQGPDRSVVAGRRAIEAALAVRGRVLAHDLPLVTLAGTLGLADPPELCGAVAEGRLCADEIARRLIEIVDGPDATPFDDLIEP
ncbi:MAG TPA: RelA/SpoT family protein [Cryptosporangiaceae bacterium]|nr:RelA/SpoT family protein [Cryptosporangiaceae bacterium]